MFDDEECVWCADTGVVCEDHPYLPWGPMCCDGPALRRQPPRWLRWLSRFRWHLVCKHVACHCGAPGIPCRDGCEGKQQPVVTA